MGKEKMLHNSEKKDKEEGVGREENGWFIGK